jgi:hypothetical protein
LVPFCRFSVLILVSLAKEKLMKSRRSWFGWRFVHRVLVVFVVLALLPLPVFADTVIPDGDGLVPVATNNVNFGTICAGTTTTKSVLLAVERQRVSGNPNGLTFANGSVVRFVVWTFNGTPFSPAATANTTITMPGNWVTISNGTLSGSASATVTIAAPLNTPNNTTYTGNVLFAAQGVNPNGQFHQVFGNLPVRATIVRCDTSAPVLNLPADQTVEATGPGGAVVTFSATATDANPTNPPVTCTPASGSTFPIATTAVSCAATDAAGNSANGTFNVTVRDTTPPAVGQPVNVTMEAAGPDGAAVTFAAPTATDIVDGGRPVTCLPVSGTVFPLGNTTVTCTAADMRNNTGVSSFTVKVQDTTAPVLVVPDDITAEAVDANGAPVSYAASANDVVSGAILPACTPPSGSIFPLTTSPVNCTATDAANNSVSAGFNVIVRDTTPPVLTLPASFDVEATGAAGAAVDYPTSALDAVSGSTAVTCSPAAGSVFPLGETTVSCTSADGSGNVGGGSFVVTVKDTTAPNLVVPPDQRLEATSPAGAAATFGASATDAVDANPLVACSATSGATFPLGTTTISCTARDAAGNEAQGSFVIIVEDTTAPTLNGVPPGGTVEATGPGGIVANFTVTASDIADPDVTASCIPSAGTTIPLGITNFTCTATDDSGNTATAAFAITVVDTTPPVLTVPDSQVLEATSPSGAAATFAAAGAVDVVDPAPTVSCDALSGATFPLGTTTVTCTAVDFTGNSVQAGFTIQVRDTTAPTWTADATSTQAEATGPNGAVVNYGSPTAADAVSPPVVVCAPPSGSQFALGATSVTCTATDAAGNAATKSFNVAVVDSIAPAVTCGAADGVWRATDAAIACTASDGGSGLLNAGDAAFTLNTNVAPGTETDNAVTNSREVKDIAGNTATAGPISGNRVDKKAPAIAITVPAAGSYVLNGAAAANYGCTDGGSGVANCTGPVGSGANIDTATPGAKTFTVTARDAVGNQDSRGVAYTVVYASGSSCLGSPSRGILQPVNADGSSVFKQGSTVPAKFRVCDANGNSIGTPGVVTSFTAASSSNASASIVNETIVSTTPDTAFRWDAAAQQWIFNISTKGLKAGLRYNYTVGLNDGSQITFSFTLR